MSDLIQLLPESIANQIAAGEVVQRPASVVKELMENAIDAGALNIQVIVKEAGKTLVQVIDDGNGMSLTDARMCFERHATSKIRKSDDLFHIRTMGFRGEAMASIAAVAQVELKTKTRSDELGTVVNVEGSKIKKHEHVACLQGTSLEVRHLFYNVPARRNFLKSNPVEMRHIIDEFQRAALGHPGISFRLFQNDIEVYNLPPGKLVKRIKHLFGKNYQEQLVAVSEETPHLKITGYVGKPEYSKKTRGEQFLFVNQRYIRSNYLNHAVQSSFENLLPADHFPFFVIFLDIDPANIDVNVHPTKTEIKFVDERTVYGVIKSSVKQALGQHNISPSLDFNTDINIDLSASLGGANAGRTEQEMNYERFRGLHEKEANIRNWETLYDDRDTQKADRSDQSGDAWQERVILGSKLNNPPDIKQGLLPESPEKTATTFQLHGRYIISQVKSGMMVVNQVAAHQRIIFEKYLEVIRTKSGSSQRLLFPVTIELNPSDFALLLDIKEEIESLGFDFEIFGKNAIIIHGIPPGVIDINEKEIFEGLIEQYKLHKEKLEIKIHENLALAMAKYTCMREGKILKAEERLVLIDQLFGCRNPNYSPFGESTYHVVNLDQLESYFKKKN